jgi:hypothetical protein
MFRLIVAYCGNDKSLQDFKKTKDEEFKKKKQSAKCPLKNMSLKFL